MRALLFRLLPYGIAMVAGAVVYALARAYVGDQGLHDLLVSVASGLFSVPFVFVGYEVVKAACDRRLNRSWATHLYFEFNEAVIGLLAAMRRLGVFEEVNEDVLGALAELPKAELGRRLRPDPALAPAFAAGKSAINDIAHKAGHLEVLPPDDVRTILEIARQAGIVGAELRQPPADGSRHGLLASLGTMLDLLDRWLDSQGAALAAHHAFRLLDRPEPKTGIHNS